MYAIIRISVHNIYSYIESIDNHFCRVSVTTTACAVTSGSRPSARGSGSASLLLMVRHWQVISRISKGSQNILIYNFIIHSFIPAISTAPLQVLYYSEALPTTARILYRRFTPKRTGNAGKGLAQGPYMAARAGVEPTTLQLRVIASTNAPPCPTCFLVIVSTGFLWCLPRCCRLWRFTSITWRFRCKLPVIHPWAIGLQKDFFLVLFAYTGVVDWLLFTSVYLSSLWFTYIVVCYCAEWRTAEKSKVSCWELWMGRDHMEDLIESGQITSINDPNQICTAWLYLHETEDCGNRRWNLHSTPMAHVSWWWWWWWCMLPLTDENSDVPWNTIIILKLKQQNIQPGRKERPVSSHFCLLLTCIVLYCIYTFI